MKFRVNIAVFRVLGKFWTLMVYIAGCLKLLDTLPETVYRVCELLTVVTQRNGQGWQNMVLTSLVKEVCFT